ncbi:MAG: membrane dipeptidase [Phycisphaeraceae bacterium]|nr:membrane dipeptidase [Phycisphaeraceae bacterium]
MGTATRFFDAHLDLAYLAGCGRDMRAGVDVCGGPHLPAAVTFPALREGGVRACLGTIFTQALPAGGAGPEVREAQMYAAGDAEAAHRAGVVQVEQYRRWADEGLVRLMGRRGDASWRGLDEAGSGDAPGVGICAPGGETPLHVGILMECADPIRSPDELGWWVERGVVAIGLAWALGSRYAGGNHADPDEAIGLSDLGRDLVKAMDALGVVHDVSHLSRRATDELLSLASGAVMASHSNSRGLFDRDPYPHARQRHLADETICEIARRGGVVGINLLSDFLDPGIAKGQRADLEWVVRHVERVCELAGGRHAVGLGSDMDGGFGAERLPKGIDGVDGLRRVGEALERAGWDRGAIVGFENGNWAGFWGGG